MRITTAIVLAITLLLTACSKATPENYEKIASGMKRDAVYSILGKPDTVSATGAGPYAMSSEYWNGKTHVISITFGGDTVALKNISPVGGE